MHIDDFGARMKNYENAFRHYLPGRMPVVIRIDGCHFHSFTKGMDKPFDEPLIRAFWETCKYLALNLMGCKLVYHQSDEISILLTNYDKLTTSSWFENNLQKMVSVASSIATAKFNEEIRAFYPDRPLATFDARAWVLPLDEVTNYFLWRQMDATKNSISMFAQAHFAHRELQGLDGSSLQEKLFAEKGLNWNDLPAWQKRGACVVKREFLKGTAVRRRWEVDLDTPVFSQDRAYINRFVYSDREKDV